MLWIFCFQLFEPANSEQFWPNFDQLFSKHLQHVRQDQLAQDNLWQSKHVRTFIPTKRTVTLFLKKKMFSN